MARHYGKKKLNKRTDNFRTNYFLLLFFFFGFSHYQNTLAHYFHFFFQETYTEVRCTTNYYQKKMIILN